MAKLIKNALISTETVILGILTSPLTQIEPPRADAPSFTETQMDEFRSQAWQEGYAAGKKEEHELITQKMEELKQQLETLLASIPQAITEARGELSGEIADIILLITQQYFIEKQSNPEALKLQINHILSQLTSKQNIELYLHPRDIGSLQKGFIQLETAHLNGLKICEDSAIALGGCIIKTDHGMFDAGIEKQIDKLKEFLLQIKHGRHNALPN